MRSTARSRSRLAAAAAAAALHIAAPSSGCAFDEGLPWGILEVELAASFAPQGERLDDRGRLKTVQDYRVRVDAVDVTLGALTVTQLAAGVDAAFDPSDPPDGYTLCHSGHCHHDSGAVVSYEDIAAELAEDAGATGPRLTIDVAGVASVPFGGVAEVPLMGCAGGCQLERGAMGQLSAPLETLTVRGQVFDALAGEAARLPAEGVAFDVTVSDPVTLSRALGAVIGRGEAVGLRLEALVTIPASVFDGVDWASDAAADLPARLAEAVSKGAGLEITERRFGPQ